MTLLEVFNLEKENFNAIILYKEGMFWKAYEKSAYAFIQQVKSYQPTKKFVKTIGDDIVSIGFPNSMIAFIEEKMKVTTTDDRILTIDSKLITEEEFVSWKEGIDHKEIKLKKDVDYRSPAKIEQTDQIVDVITKFQVETKTPLECMLFVIKLREMVNGDL